MVRLFTTNTVGPLLVAQQLEKRGLLGKGSTLANMTSKMGRCVRFFNLLAFVFFSLFPEGSSSRFLFLLL